ncbi:hypothetical protein HDU98_001487 [Podochytrium sp. JEL0797]|nr:hypothetical protein HDU98_001487 [Podochytrium sp. JEL0797]
MSTSILASTTISLMFGFITFLTGVPKNSNVGGNLTFGLIVDDLYGAKLSDADFASKVMVISLVLCLGFFFFAIALRFYSHVSMVINMEFEDFASDSHLEERNKKFPEGEARKNAKRIEEKINIDFIAGMLNQGSFWQSAGLRCYYLVFPTLMFLWGPWALLGGTVLLLVAMWITDFNVDRFAPKHLRLREKKIA